MAEGASCHGAATRSGVSASSARRWAGPLRREGQVALRTRGGDQRSLAIEAPADLICAIYEAQATICLHELCAALAERGMTTSTSDCRASSPATASPAKGARYAAEHKRAGVKAAREDWFASQDALDTARPSFLNETAAATNVTRLYGWAPRSQRCRIAVPQGVTKPPPSPPRCPPMA